VDVRKSDSSSEKAEQRAAS